MAEARHYTIELPAQPMGANERRRAHWAVQYRDTKAFRDAVALLATQQHTGPPVQRARVDVTLIRRRGQAPLDPDNAVSRVKSVVDALVVAGIVPDDSQRHVDLHVHQQQGLSRATRLEIQEVIEQ